MRVLDGTAGGELAARFTADLERAMLAHALADLGTLPDERVKALLRDWLIGTFNPRAAALDSDGDDRGTLAWQPDGSGYRLVWFMPTGLACPLARLYEQADDSWVALVVAGVKDGMIEAMAAAEWGVSRLTSL